MKRSPPLELSDLVSVGPATLKDFALLEIRSLQDLAHRDAQQLFQQLCQSTKCVQDPCVEDVFKAAIEQAKDPFLEPEKKQWHYWSRKRKSSSLG